MSAEPLCAHCQERPVAERSSRYCETCKESGKYESAKAARRKPCRRCGGPKGNVTPGNSYCAPCREVRAPINEQYETDRARQDEIARRENALLEGRTSRGPRVKAPDGQKWCTRCQRILPLTSFPKSGKKLGPYCVPCQRAYSHARNLRITFGITPEQYGQMYDAQGGRCAICLRRPRTSRLAVDHDHATGEIRGLLCYRCNKQILGHAMESPALLRRAANYLEEPPARSRKPLESLDHFAEQARHVFADDAEHMQDGAVVIDASGEMVAISYRTLLAVAQVAGFALMVDGEVINPRDQMDLADLAIVEALWRSHQRQMRAAS